jgi:O-antigen/teichoic acid export membrane protein
MKQKSLQAMTSKVTIVIALSLVSTNVFAYLDPSTGSMIVSAIVGIFASLALAVKTYWYKIKGLFRRGEKTVTDSPEDSSSEG